MPTFLDYFLAGFGLSLGYFIARWILTWVAMVWVGIVTGTWPAMPQP